MRRKPTSIMGRLLSKRRIDSKTGCWLFTGAIQSNGYGLISYRNKRVTVHRLSAHLFKNFNINLDVYIFHTDKCLNRHCFNPEHIKEGTHSSNMQDMKDKNIYCKRGHIISGLKHRSSGQVDRVCKLCSNINRKAWYDRKHGRET